MTKLRYATWQAVSSKAQASENKVSLKVQLEACVNAGKSRGWVHVKDYTVPGQTRTRWVSLYHAEKSIPQLHALLEAASRHEFDVLVIYDLNRFRDLMRQIFDVLCDLGIQLYILSDPREPVAPADYTEERMSEVGLTVGLRDIISRSEISSLRKHYRDKMPQRIKTKRLHAGLGLPPYGYRKPAGQQYNRDAVLEQVPEQVRILKQIKDLFLQGHSLTAIAQKLNDQGTPSPRGKRWWYPNVGYMLANSFYAGIVSFGASQTVRNRRQGTVSRRQNTPVTAVGLHKPIWDMATHQQLKDELERRGKAHPGVKTRQLSRLLYCSCGKVLWSHRSPKGEYWRCSTHQKKHSAIRNDDAMSKLIELIVSALENIDQLKLPTPEDNRPSLRLERRDLLAKQTRWMDLFEDGKLDKDALTERIAAIQTRLEKNEKLIQQNDQHLARTAATRANLRTLSASLHDLPRYYQTAPPAQVNAELHAILERVEVSQDKQLTLIWN